MNLRLLGVVHPYLIICMCAFIIIHLTKTTRSGGGAHREGGACSSTKGIRRPYTNPSNMQYKLLITQ